MVRLISLLFLTILMSCSNNPSPSKSKVTDTIEIKGDSTEVGVILDSFQTTLDKGVVSDLDFLRCENLEMVAMLAMDNESMDNDENYTLHLQRFVKLSSRLDEVRQKFKHLTLEKTN